MLDVLQKHIFGIRETVCNGEYCRVAYIEIIIINIQYEA